VGAAMNGNLWEFTAAKESLSFISLKWRGVGGNAVIFFVLIHVFSPLKS
jgi:hypothetical protein